MRRFAHTPAQAMVEFALAATLIFLLLAAAVDLGLLFFTKQALTAAAQEGATFGSRWLADGPSGSAKLDIPEIQNRVRFESGTGGGNNVIKLVDLNSDSINDTSQGGVIDPNGTTGYIQVRSLADTNMDGNPTNDGGALCTDPSRSVVSCYVYVTVKKIHNMFFPITAIFSSRVNVQSSYYMLIRSSYRSNNSSPPTFATPTPAPDAAKIVIDLSSISSTFPSSQSGTAWQPVAYYDPGGGAPNGTGIDHVFSKITYPEGTTRTNDDYGAAYNAFASGKMSNADWTTITVTSPAAYRGTYTLEVTVYATNGVSRTVTKLITKP